MNGAQKAKSPGGAGPNAENKTDSTSVTESSDARNLDKRRSNAIARLALRGHITTPVLTGGFFVSRHGLSRHCKNIDELERFAALVGAA